MWTETTGEILTQNKDELVGYVENDVDVHVPPANVNNISAVFMKLLTK